MLAELIRRQREAGENDAEFSQRLGIPRSTWYNTRTDIIPLGPRVVRAALAVWPDLREAALDWLTSNGEEAAG